MENLIYITPEHSIHCGNFNLQHNIHSGNFNLQHAWAHVSTVENLIYNSSEHSIHSGNFNLQHTSTQYPQWKI